MLRCPCCQARLGDAVDCPRCQADLRAVASAEKGSEICLANAIRAWQCSDLPTSVLNLEQALFLKHSSLAAQLRNMLIANKAREIFALLAKREIVEAKRRLFALRHLYASSPLLCQLNQFSDYLLSTQVKSLPLSSRLSLALHSKLNI